MDEHVIPIATLSPNIEDASTKSIRAIVTLLWPYSSATRSSSLLLADPDFRLRRSKGQVRVYLQGTAAQAVAESRIGIGDEVNLSLDGAQWQEDQSDRDVISTPGKNVDWQLVYRRRITLRAYRNGQELQTVDVDQQAVSPERRIVKDALSTPGPVSKEWATRSTPSLLFKHGRLSGDSLTFSTYDPFLDGETRAKKRPRRSWHNVESWTLSKRSPSPEKDTDPFQVDDGLSESSSEQEGMEAPSSPGLHTPLTQSDPSADDESTLAKSGTAGAVDPSSNVATPAAVSREPSPQPGAEDAVGSTSSRHNSIEQMQIEAPFITRDSQGSCADSETDNDDNAAEQAVLSRSTQERLFAVFKDAPSAPQGSFTKKVTDPSEDPSLKAASAGGSDNQELSQPHQADVGKGRTGDHTKAEAEFRSASEDDSESEPVKDTNHVVGQNDSPRSHGAVSTTGSPRDMPSITGISQQQAIVLDDSDEDESSSEVRHAECLSLPDHSVQAFDKASAGSVFEQDSPSKFAAPLTPALPHGMPPPAVPSLLLRTASDDLQKPQDNQSTAPKTPELRGVASPTLPLPSPFPAANETTATSFLDVRPQQRSSGRRTSAPKTIKETLQEEKHKLRTPRSDRRTSRTSSSSSYRRESGPFADHIRAARPFGLDGVSGSVEEAVTDSPEIKPINREIPGLKTLESLSEVTPELPEDVIADRAARAQVRDPADDGMMDVDGQDDHAPAWMSEEWLEPPTGFFDEFLVTSDEVPPAPLDSGAHTSHLPTARDALSPSAMFGPLIDTVNHSHAIDLDSDSKEIEISELVNSNEYQPTSSHVSFEQATLPRSDTQQPSFQVSDSRVATDHARDDDGGRSVSNPDAPVLQESEATALTEKLASSSADRMYPDLPVYENMDESPTRTLPSSNGVNAMAAQQSPVNSAFSYPELPSSPTPAVSRESPVPQLTPPPTAPTHSTEHGAAPPTPELTQGVGLSLPSNPDEQVHGAAPLTPMLTQATMGPTSSNSKTSGVEGLHLSSFSSAVSPWFAPSRQNLRSGEVQSEPDLSDEDSVLEEDATAQDDSLSERVKSTSTNERLPVSGASPATKAKDRLRDLFQHIEVPSDDANGHLVVPKGFRTPTSYYTPLHPTLLRPYLNASSQHESTIDVIAVVSSPSSRPKRAEKGPRDWHQIVSVITPDTLAAGDTWPTGEVQIQCFMGGKNGSKLLPNAQPGDVILLRDFSVISEKGRLGLMNRSRGCGWCVWKWESGVEANETADMDDNERTSELHLASREEINGAPVELGDAEREEARRLRVWYEGLAREDANGT